MGILQLLREPSVRFRCLFGVLLWMYRPDAWFRISATSVPCPCFCRSIAVSHLLAFQPACLPCFRSVPVFSLTLPGKGLSCLNCPNVISGFPFPDFRRTRKQSTLLKHFDGMPSFTAICFMVQCNGWELWCPSIFCMPALNALDSRVLRWD